jgi:hypothetical protein
MKNLSGASLLNVLPVAHRPNAKLPLPAAKRAGGGPGDTTARSLARRLALILHDLGLVGVVPDGWVSVEGSTIRFGPLDVPAAGHLICHLEDVAADVADNTSATAAARRTPGAGQAALFGRVEL